MSFGPAKQYVVHLGFEIAKVLNDVTTPVARPNLRARSIGEASQGSICVQSISRFLVMLMSEI